MNLIPNLGTTEVSFETDKIILKPQSDDDRKRLTVLFPTAKSMLDWNKCVGVWQSTITFVVAGLLTFRCQTPADAAKISVSCPTDQTANYSMAWVDGNVELALITDIDSRPSEEQQELARVSAMTEADLQTLAAELGVEWDEKASRKTMVERVVAAAEAARSGKADVEMPPTVTTAPPAQPAQPPPAKSKGKGK